MGIVTIPAFSNQTRMGIYFSRIYYSYNAENGIDTR